MSATLRVSTTNLIILQKNFTLIKQLFKNKTIT